MTETWVVDASPLILLGKIEQAALVLGLARRLVIPKAVAREVSVHAEGRRLLEELRESSRVRVQSKVPAGPLIEAWGLGPGESQVLAICSSEGSDRAVLDDREARRCAQSLNVPVIGTLGVVLRARRKGLLGAARPIIDELRRVGLDATDELVERALVHLGE